MSEQQKQKLITIPYEYFAALLNEVMKQQSEIAQLRIQDNDRRILLKTIVKEVKNSKTSLSKDSILFSIIERSSKPKRYGYLN